MGIIQNIGKMFNPNNTDEIEIDDAVTKDKYLRSLRRQRRIQLEEGEKKRLKAQISKFNRERDSKQLFGSGPKTKRTKEKYHLTKFKKEKYMFATKNPLIKCKKIKKRKMI